MKKNFIFIYSTAFIIFFIALFNYLIDPYYIFFNKTNGISYDLIYYGEYDRYIIYPLIKLSKKQKYDCCIVGSSATKDCFNVKIFDKVLKIQDFNCFNLSIPAATINEEYELVKNFIKIHPEVKKIIISIDLQQMSENYKLNNLPSYKYNFLNINEIFFLLFSKTTLINSIKTINLVKKHNDLNDFSILKDNLRKYKDNEKHSVYKFRNLYPKRKIIFPINNKEYIEKNLSTIKKIKDLLDEKNIDCIFYTSPLHGYSISEFYYKDKYEILENLKNKIVEITPFYDFTYVGKYSKDSIDKNNVYWSDPSVHYEITLGNKIIKKIILNKGDFGIFIDKNNIRKVLSFEKKELERYIKDYNKEVKNFINSEGDENFSMKVHTKFKKNFLLQ